MTPERWARVKELFHDALEMAPAERDAYVGRMCGSDNELAEELRSLLADPSATSIPPIPPATVARALGDSFIGDDGIRSILERALGKEYEILHRIGHGGMGTVYRARQIALDLQVAIKVLRPDLAAYSAAARARFKREARICASLSHPGIIHLYQYGEACGIWYFVMSYVPGETLADRLRLEGPVPPRETRRMLLELADALEYAHRHHVIHRDIKAANILLENGDVMRPMLADFGISKLKGVEGTMPQTDGAIGTPAYMSPEQLVADPDIDERSDIFSLGLVGYAMLTGKEPFAGIDNVVTWRMRNDPAPLSKVAPSVPSGIAEVITRCLQRDRASRFPDARSVKEALARTDGEWQPHVVRPIAGYGQYALLWAVIWTALAVVPAHTATNVAFLLLLAVLVPLGLVLHILSTGLGNLTYTELAKVACWPPEWWGMWWPPMIRRPDDLWTRLPWQGQLTRAMLSLFFVMIPVLILVENSQNVDARVMDAIKYSLLVGTVVAMAGAALWTRANQLPFPDGVRVLLGSTMPSPAWQVEHVARLLAPVRGVRPPNPSDPSDWVRAIDELVPLIPAADAPLGAEVTLRAHRLLRAISKHEGEMVRFGRYSSDTEVERLDREIAEIEDEISHGGSDKYRNLLKPLQDKREAVLAMRADHERAESERGEFFKLLRELWTQLRKLYERSVGRAVDGPDAAAVLRSLCDEIDEGLDPV